YRAREGRRNSRLARRASRSPVLTGAARSGFGARCRRCNEGFTCSPQRVHVGVSAFRANTEPPPATSEERIGMIRYPCLTSLVGLLVALALSLAAHAQTPAPVADGPSIQLLSQSDDVLPNLFRYVVAKAIHPTGKSLQLSVENPPRWTASWSFRGAVTN